MSSRAWRSSCGVTLAGAEFAHDDAGGGVGKHGGVRERCACGGSEAREC